MIPFYIAAQALQRMRDEGSIRHLAAHVPTSARIAKMKREHQRRQRVLRAEPVSTTIGLSALLFNTGVFASVGAASAFGGALIGLGSTFALSAASSALQKSNKQSQLDSGGVAGSGTLSPQARRPGTSPIPDQRLVLGTVTSSGDVLWRRYDPPYFWIIYELAAHRCGALQQVIVNGIPVSLESSASGQIISLENGATGILRASAAPFYDGATRFIEVSYRDGADNQAIDPIIARDFTTMPTTFRHRGHTTICLKLNYGSSQTAHETIYGTQNQFNPLFRFAGARYYDPRYPTCRTDDPNTWIEGRNGSLNIMRALYHPWSNAPMIDIGSINWDAMAEAADVDDEWRGKLDGTIERNHTVDGIIFSSADPLQMTKELLTAVDGFLVQRGGKYHILPGQPMQPVGTLHQHMLAGGFSIHTETPDRDLINIVKTEGIFPELDYKPSVGPILRRDDLIALDGQELETTQTFPFTEGSSRLQRLGARKMLELRGSGSGQSSRKGFSGTFGIAAKNVKAGQIWRVAFKDFPKANMDLFVTSTSRDETGSLITIEGVSWSNERFAWNALTNEKAFSLDDNVLDAEAA